LSLRLWPRDLKFISFRIVAVAGIRVGPHVVFPHPGPVLDKVFPCGTDIADSEHQLVPILRGRSGLPGPVQTQPEALATEFSPFIDRKARRSESLSPRMDVLNATMVFISLQKQICV
jgi:hypothetical protein